MVLKLSYTIVPCGDKKASKCHSMLALECFIILQFVFVCIGLLLHIFIVVSFAFPYVCNNINRLADLY